MAPAASGIDSLLSLHASPRCTHCWGLGSVKGRPCGCALSGVHDAALNALEERRAVSFPAPDDCYALDVTMAMRRATLRAADAETYRLWIGAGRPGVAEFCRVQAIPSGVVHNALTRAKRAVGAALLQHGAYPPPATIARFA